MISTTRTSPQFPRKTRSKPFQLNKNSSSFFLHVEAVRFSWYAALSQYFAFVYYPFAQQTLFFKILTQLHMPLEAILILQLATCIRH